MKVFDKINLNNEITINDEKFKCVEIVDYTYIEGTYTEYKLESMDNKKVTWLEVENGDAYLYKSINNTEFNNFKYKYSNGKSYSGISKVKSFSKNADLDVGEAISFIDIYSADEENVISIETWENGEVEYSLGKCIDINDILVEIPINTNYNSKKKPKLAIGLVICAVIILLCIININSRKNCGQVNCEPSNPALCCIDTDKCIITNDDCESIYKYSSSIRNSSVGVRRPIGGGTSFGK